jgi:transcriptional regulatory protein LevR
MSIEDRQRWARIENALATTTELQKEQRLDIDKILNGTRDLIAVSRVFLDSIKEMREQHDADYRKIREQHEADYKELRELSRETSEKLNILIDTVDRIIRKNGKRGDK